MLPNRYGRSYEGLPRAHRAALGAIAGLVIRHLRAELGRRPADASAPLLIQLEGPGDTDLVELVADRLSSPQADPAWTVIRFDAWQYQRVAPPWWWLVTAIDRQLRMEFQARGTGVRVRKRMRDHLWRLRGLLRDLLPVLPFVVVAAGLWYLAEGDRARMDEFLRWAAGVTGALTTVGAFVWSAVNVVRRLFVTSPATAAAALRTSDPMADFQRRYSFLIRSAGQPVALVVDNLDRCRADYVVELLEGVQTLLKDPAPELAPTPLVAVFVPADRVWLCDSYLHVYEEFRETTREPGRPFGLAFVDKVFDVSLRLPAIPAAASLVEEPDGYADVRRRIRSAERELELRTLVADAERAHADGAEITPLYRLRLDAVERLGQLEVESDERHCIDTAGQLEALIDRTGASPAVVRQLRTAYCVQRTVQLLGGHVLDDDSDAIHRLGLWTILGLRWPLLSQRLVDHPDDILLLQDDRAPDGVDEELARVFCGGEAGQLTCAWPRAELTPDAVRRFSRALRSVRVDSGEPTVAAANA